MSLSFVTLCFEITFCIFPQTSYFFHIFISVMSVVIVMMAGLVNIVNTKLVS